MRLIIGLMVLVFMAACEPQIGDSCSATSGTDCPRRAFCDRTMPGGYCTFTPCSDHSDCPGASYCIRFDNTETYCMAPCDKNSDCRKGYECLTDFEDNQYCGVPR